MKLQQKLELLKRSKDKEKTNTHEGIAGQGDVELPFSIECYSTMSQKYLDEQTDYNRELIEADQDPEKVGAAFAKFMTAITKGFVLDGDALSKADIQELYMDNSSFLTLSLDTARKDAPFIKALPKNSSDGQRDNSSSGKKSIRKTKKA